MEILNLGGAQESTPSEKKSRTPLRVLLGIGALAAVVGVGSTLAANISLNGGGNVEFGQGVATTASCDGEITVTPISEFNSADDAFYLNSIQLSGIDTGTQGEGDTVGCAGKTLTIKAYDNSSNTPLYSAEVIVSDGSPYFTASGVGVVVSVPSESGFTLDASASDVDAGDVFKITVESKDTPA